MVKLLTHEQFLEAELRKAKDWDGWDGIQCVDAVKMYSEKVHGIKLWTFWGSARAGWLNKSKTFDLKKLVRVPNTPTGIPPQGAIIFFDEPALTGHTAIVHSADINDIINIELNGATGNGEGKGYDALNFEVKRDYRKCLGWYYPKK